MVASSCVRSASTSDRLASAAAREGSKVSAVTDAPTRPATQRRRKVSLRKGSRQEPGGMLIERTGEETVVDCALYLNGQRQKGRLPYEGALQAADESGG